MNNYNEISQFYHQSKEQVFTTKNGSGDLVVLSNTEDERLCGKAELHRLLDEGLEAMNTEKSRPAKDVFAALEKEFGFGGI